MHGYCARHGARYRAELPRLNPQVSPKPQRASTRRAGGAGCGDRRSALCFCMPRALPTFFSDPPRAPPAPPSHFRAAGWSDVIEEPAVMRFRKYYVMRLLYEGLPL